jgi:hypothetical protein
MESPAREHKTDARGRKRIFTGYNANPENTYRQQLKRPDVCFLRFPPAARHRVGKGSEQWFILETWDE